MAATVWTLAVSVLTCALTIGQAADITECTVDASICGCKSEKGDVNLKSFGNTGLTAQSKQTLYTWNPCKDITIHTTTASVVQYYTTGQLSYDLGRLKSVSPIVTAGQVEFDLRADDSERLSKITCVCTSGNTFTFDKEEHSIGISTFYLTLRSKHCCPGYKEPASGGLSGGSILLIVFFVLVIVYIAAGVAVQTGIRKAEGKERFPNVDFWSALPGLIKDGCKFTFSCGKSPSYQGI